MVKDRKSWYKYYIYMHNIHAYPDVSMAALMIFAGRWNPIDAVAAQMRFAGSSRFCTNCWVCAAFFSAN